MLDSNDPVPGPDVRDARTRHWVIRTAFVALVVALGVVGVIVVEHNIAPSARAIPAGALSLALKSGLSQ